MIINVKIISTTPTCILIFKECYVPVAEQPAEPGDDVILHICIDPNKKLLKSHDMDYKKNEQVLPEIPGE